MRKFAIAALSLLVAACSSGGSEPETIKIGFIGPLTGAAASYGADALNGMRVQVDSINAAGGINGKQIEIIAEDGRCTGADAAGAAQKLVNVNGVVAIIGGQCSGETLAAAPIVNAGQVVMISPISSSPDVTDAGDFVFRDYPSDALKTIATAKYLQDEGLTRVAIISENTDFCSSFRKSLLEQLPDGAVVFDETVDQDTKDFRTLMTRLQNTEFDVFFANGQSTATIAAMMVQMREQGIEQPGLSHDVGQDKTVIEIAGSAVDGFRAINVPAVGEDTEFGLAFNAQYSAQAALAFAAHSYDAMGVLAQAIANVGTDGAAIRDYLYNLDSYNGAVGNFHFDKNGDVIGIPYVLWEVQNDKFVGIQDIDVN